MVAVFVCCSDAGWVRVSDDVCVSGASLQTQNLHQHNCRLYSSAQRSAEMGRLGTRAGMAPNA